MNRKEFLERRKAGLGGSDAAVVAGASKWKTALELYLEKRGELDPDDEPKEYLLWGNEHEETVARIFGEAFGLKVRRTSHLYRHPEHPFMIANLDRIIEGERTLYEGKTSNAFNLSDWGPGIPLELTTDPETFEVRYKPLENWRELVASGAEAYDGVPEYYMIQVQHSLAASEREDAFLAVLIGGSALRVYYIRRDEALIEALIELEASFWKRVETGNAPTADYAHDSTRELLKRRYPNCIPQAIELPGRGSDLAERIQTLKAEAKAVSQELKEAENELYDLVGDNAAAVFADGSAFKRTWIKGGPVSYERKGYFRPSFSKSAPKDLPRVSAEGVPVSAE